MSRTALAFMSYVNEDDRHDNGWMTQFRERLSGEVRMHTGEPFDIFQDRKDIAWGQQWQDRINQSLDAVTFLIPILTPAFFKSAACRDELERFLKREETLGRSDLILPVYYVNCPVLQDKAKREQDELAKTIAARQYADWRDLRFEDFTSPQLRKALAKMAQQIMEALERRQPLAPAATTEPHTIIVDQKGRGDYATITDAIKAAKSGTRILVRPGLYKEAIVIDKPVEIEGDGDRNDIVIESFYKHVGVLFRADNGKITNLTIRQNGIEDWVISRHGKSCIDISQGKLKLDDCVISGKGMRCVLIHGSATPCLCRNRILDAPTYGIDVRGPSQSTLEDNEISVNGLGGVIITSNGSATLRRNCISQNGGVGIRVCDNGGGIFEDNDLRDNDRGAWDIDPDCEANVQRRGNKE
ncbi:right-handed parallel beta-helix repeat-containing protein [Candidatus Electronema sp. JC]|uniref:right-handed parallel beta-helix repeat-containing protein n=1 Tax=Candidatus Electronema sp. JC TaxID=3401570 RepID=UPI003AA7E397